MTDARKFYATEITIRILSEEEPWDGNLQWLSHDLTYGEYVGDQTSQIVTELTADAMRAAMADIGANPDYFDIVKDEPSTKQTYVVTAEGVE